MLTIKQLRAFAAAARSLSFTRAAEQLHVSQSAVSLLIRDLEETLDVRLFERGRRLALTEAGRDFARAADKMLVDLELAVANMREARDAQRGVIRFGVGHLLAATLFPAAMAEFGRRHPAIDVQIVDCPVEQLAAKVLGNEVDVAIGSIDFASRYPDLRIEPLFRDSVYVASATGPGGPAPLAATAGERRRRSLPWRRLQGEPLILVNASNRRWAAITSTLARQGIELSIAREVALYSTGLALARRGLGRLLLPGFCAAAPDLRDMEMLPLAQPVIRWDVSVLRRRAAPPLPAADRLLELLRQAAA